MHGKRFPVHACFSNHKIVKCAAGGPGMWASLFQDWYSRRSSHESDRDMMKKHPKVEGIPKPSAAFAKGKNWSIMVQ